MTDTPADVEDLKRRLAAAEAALRERDGNTPRRRPAVGPETPLDGMDGALFDSLDEGMAIQEMIRDDRGEIVDVVYRRVNRAFERQGGVHDVVDRSIFDVLPNVEDHWLRLYRRVATTGEALRETNHQQDVDRWFDVSFSRIDEGGRFVATIFKDVTDVKRSELALQESETRNRLLVESVAQAVWETDAEGVVVTDSPSWRAYTGQSLEELLGYGWLDAIHPDDRDFAERQWRAALAARGIVDAEFRLRAPDGGWRWTNVRAAPLMNTDGRIRKWAGLNIDIDARKRAESGLRESEERFQQFAASSSDALWIRDAGTLDMEYTSPAMETVYGIAPDAVLGDFRLWFDLIVPEDRDGAIDHIAQARNGRSATHEFRIRRPSDGEVRWIRDTDFPLRDAQGRDQRIGGLAEDITEARNLRERQTVLVAELQHRTRNLLSVVRSTADKTARASVDLPDFRERFGRRLAALARVQGLLSRLDEWDRVTFDELLSAELSAMNGEARQVTLDGPTGIALRSSTVQTFALALHELATNALKYGALAHPAGRLAIAWRLEHRPPGDRPWLHVDWREHGVAMPERDAIARGVALTGGGSGRELIERALPYQLGAETTFLLKDDGIHCTIALPVSERQEAGRTSDGPQTPMRPTGPDR